MKIKAKLSLGLVVLYLVLLIVGLLGYFAINILAANADLVLKDNYESVVYIKNMHQALDAIEKGDPGGFAVFQTNLDHQEHNITEPGEAEATHDVREKFESLKKERASLPQTLAISAALYKIEDLNLSAIVRKHNDTTKVAGKAKLYLGIITTVLLLFTFSFIVNFPGYIANPIQELTRGINLIAAEDYSQRLYFKSSDEFGELAAAFNTMARQLEDYRKSSLAKIMLEKKYVETIINNMKDPIIGFNDKNVIQFVNKEAVKILGVKESELTGVSTFDLVLKNDLLRTLLQNDHDMGLLRIYADNKESYFNKEAYYINIDNQALGTMLLLRNVTAYQEQSLAKTNFMANISHELKTPISSIKMGIALLEDKRIGNINAEQAKLVEAIKDDTQRLLKITGELLDLAQVETGNVKLHKVAVHPVGIANHAFEAVKQLADTKSINIIINSANNLPDVICDPEKTGWVLINFLTNAIRYSPEKANVYVYITHEDNHTVFAVKDTGPGIDPKYIGKLFDKYFQLPNSDHARVGTGLGLALAKELIEAQNGKISVDSEPGKGSTFYFSL